MRCPLLSLTYDLVNSKTVPSTYPVCLWDVVSALATEKNINGCVAFAVTEYETLHVSITMTFFAKRPFRPPDLHFGQSKVSSVGPFTCLKNLLFRCNIVREIDLLIGLGIKPMFQCRG